MGKRARRCWTALVDDLGYAGELAARDRVGVVVRWSRLAGEGQEAGELATEMGCGDR